MERTFVSGSWNFYEPIHATKLSRIQSGLSSIHMLPGPKQTVPAQEKFLMEKKKFTHNYL